MDLRNKRFLDILIALPLMILLLPALALIAVAVRITMGSPVLFRQTRPGLGGRPFTLYKFRSMSEAKDRHGQDLPDSERLTRLGRMLRSTSLDELPELLNVLKGEMSLVGPRPLLLEYLPRYSPEESRRHAVPPGITGWAQVNGRNMLSWEEKFKLDVWYVDNLHLWLDLKILFLTLGIFMKREGISAQNHATMPKFMGTPKNRH